MRRLPKDFKRCGIPLVPKDRPFKSDMAKPGNNFIITWQPNGCTNRPFHHIIVTKTTYPHKINSKLSTIAKWVEPHEQLGTYDPMPNIYGEKLCSLNIERIIYYLSQGIEVNPEVGQLLGLAGLLPQHPETYRLAWRNRWEFEREEMKRQVEAQEEKLKETDEATEESSSSQT